MSESVIEKLVLDGKKVKLLTQARGIEAAAEGGVIVDYLRFTLRRDLILASGRSSPEATDQQVVREMAADFAKALGFVVGEHRSGRDYYADTTTIENALGQEVASVSGGGEGQRETYCFTLKGEGCTFAHGGWERRLHASYKEMLPKITRVDLAKDCYSKADLSVDAAVDAYQDHRFSYQKRKPSYGQFGCWLGEEKHSRTFQVGLRASGKLIRIYEKGHQFGMMDDEWCRAEVELRSAGRVVPWDVVATPGQYFAGAYEWCHWLLHRGLDNVEGSAIPRQVKVAEASVARVMRWVTRVVAPTLVQITAAMPDHSWLEHLVLDNTLRRVPRGLRGLDHTGLKLGLESFFKKFTDPGCASPWITPV